MESSGGLDRGLDKNRGPIKAQKGIKGVGIEAFVPFVPSALLLLKGPYGPSSVIV